MDEHENASTPKSLASLIRRSITPKSQPYLSPGGRTKEWVPCCPLELKPIKGMRFGTLLDGIKFYENYAKSCGFCVRLGTEKKNTYKVVTLKYCMCSREGFKPSKKVVVDREKAESSKSGSRKRGITRMGCNARMLLRLCANGSYMIFKFYEGHSHPLTTPSRKQFLKGDRNMTILHKKIITDNMKLNIGPSKSFRMFKEHVGGYEHVGAIQNDFKNYGRDLKAYIGDSDAQMFVDFFTKKKDMCSAYFFDYDINDTGTLIRAFWADPICRKKYALFGDSVSFDITYDTNKYNMKFRPFTGVDHHRRCVTFGAGFIAHEDVHSFKWLFETFLKVVGNIQPMFLITNQDPAMLIAIERVFDKIHHRFCMWHITEKLPKKVGPHIKETDFLTKMNSLVWDTEIEPEDFEARWMSLISEFELQDNGWLSTMFRIRKMWLPSYFRDFFMGGLLRTTSRSESENHFFNNFLNNKITLVEFKLRYESAMDSQRHTQLKFDNQSKSSFPLLETPLYLEKHASEVYTHTIFYEIQKEICVACFSCGFVDFKREGETEITMINEVKKNRVFRVAYMGENHDAQCSCKLFQRVGILCRHILWVFKTKGLKKIPRQYVLNRWTTTATKKPLFDLDGNPLEECMNMDDRKMTLGRLWSQIFECVSLVEGKEEGLNELLETLETFKDDWKSKNINHKPPSKSQVIESLIGSRVLVKLLLKFLNNQEIKEAVRVSRERRKNPWSNN